MNQREGSSENNDTAAVLIVDDSPPNLKILAQILAPHHDVMLAQSGEQALSVARANLPDLILLDILMPGMDGYEVCRELKKDPLTRDIPVLFITALATDQDERTGFAAGGVDYITKPVVPSVVLARVNTHVELKRNRDKLEERTRRLARSEELVRVLFDSLPCEVWAKDSHGVYTMQNRASRARWGDIVGGSLDSAPVGTDIERSWREQDAAASQGESTHARYTLEQDGGESHFDSVAAPVWNGVDVAGVVGIAVDETEKRNLEQLLVSRERLAATAQLAGAIAHEINSPLQGLSFALHSLDRKPGEPGRAALEINNAWEAYRSISETVRSLLDLHRPGREEKQPIFLNNVVTRTTRLLARFLENKQVALEPDLAEALPLVHASPQELGQVIVHLINNAVVVRKRPSRDSCSGEAPPARVDIRTRTDGEHVVLEVSDRTGGLATPASGSGGPTQVDNAAGDPGLAFSRAVVADHGGTIEVSGNPGNGTTVTMRFPAASPEAVEVEGE